MAHQKKKEIPVSFRKGDPDIIKFVDEGQVNEVQRLIRDGVDVNARGDYNYTALHCACKKEGNPLLQMLLDAGADMNLHDNTRNLPLHWACEYGAVTAVEKFMAAGIDINWQNRGGYSPLMLAVYHNQGKIAKMLMDAGADTQLITGQNLTAYKICNWKTKEQKYDYQKHPIFAMLMDREPKDDAEGKKKDLSNT